MADSDEAAGEGDDILMVQAMVDRLSEAIKLAQGIGAERLVEVLEEARKAAQAAAQSKRPALVH